MWHEEKQRCNFIFKWSLVTIARQWEREKRKEKEEKRGIGDRRMSFRPVATQCALGLRTLLRNSAFPYFLFPKVGNLPFYFFMWSYGFHKVTFCSNINWFPGAVFLCNIVKKCNCLCFVCRHNTFSENYMFNCSKNYACLTFCAKRSLPTPLPLIN